MASVSPAVDLGARPRLSEAIVLGPALHRQDNAPPDQGSLGHASPVEPPAAVVLGSRRVHTFVE